MSLPFDATLKGWFERVPADWPAFVGYSGTNVTVIDADVSTVTSATDKALRVSGVPDWILDLNFQSGPDASVPQRAHLYNTLLGNRHRLLVRSVVILLSPKANLKAIDGKYEEAFEGEEPYLTFRYRVIRVWELSVDQLLAGGLGPLPLAPLADVTKKQLPSVIERMRKRLQQVPKPLQKELWTATYTLMGLRYSEELTNKLLQGVVEMEESVTYQAIIEKGFERGRLEEARDMVRLQASKLFGKPSADLTEKLEKIADVAQLHALGLKLLEVKSWEELLASPSPQPRQRKKS